MQHPMHEMELMDASTNPNSESRAMNKSKLDTKTMADVFKMLSDLNASVKKLGRNVSELEARVAGMEKEVFSPDAFTKTTATSPRSIDLGDHDTDCADCNSPKVDLRMLARCSPRTREGCYDDESPVQMLPLDSMYNLAKK